MQRWEKLFPNRLYTVQQYLGSMMLCKGNEENKYSGPDVIGSSRKQDHVRDEEHENVRALISRSPQRFYAWKHKKELLNQTRDQRMARSVTASNHRIILSLPWAYDDSTPALSIVYQQAIVNTSPYQGFTSYQLKLTRFRGLSFWRAKVQVVKQRGLSLWKTHAA